MSKRNWKHPTPLQFIFEKIARETEADMQQSGRNDDVVNNTFYRDIFFSGAETAVKLLATGCDRASIMRELDCWHASYATDGRARLQ